MAKKLFITGTGTDIGKALAKDANAQNPEQGMEVRSREACAKSAERYPARTHLRPPVQAKRYSLAPESMRQAHWAATMLPLASTSSSTV